jgi:HAD superfamily hydrolase (TIGR01509 family)
MTLKHVIFDCDGVLVDSEPLSMRADVELLRAHGIDMSEDEAHQRFVGKTFQGMLDEMTAEHGTVFPQGLHAVKNARVEEMYRAGLRIVPGVADMLQHLKSRGLSISIGSNSPRARVELAVSLTGIAPYFDRIVSFEDVVNGKPAPDIFLKAAALAVVAIDECVVVEDSLTGVTAAVAAGIQTIGFTGTHAHPIEHGVALKAVGASATLAKMSGLVDLMPRLLLTPTPGPALKGGERYVPPRP